MEFQGTSNNEINEIDMEGIYMEGIDMEGIHMQENEVDMEGIDMEENEVEQKKIEDPKVGMTFDTIDEVYDYDKKYGSEMGFPVRKRSSGKDDDGVVKFVVFSCSHSGKPKSRSKNAFKKRPVTNTDCKAKIRIALCFDGKWVVTIINLDHNHAVSLGKSRYYKNNRILRPFVKRRLEMNDKARIRPNKNFDSVVVEAGGYENVIFLEKNCYNFINRVRMLRLGEGGAIAVQQYFMNMQSNNVNFFYLIDFDNEGRFRNVFWAAARSRAAYDEFGDAITFDTTYLTNKYDMPFAPFVGVNHHGHSTLLGCGLISNEDVKTFTWLFNAWIVCMNGRTPTAIITDQDRRMKNAIEVVFPHTKHRWCLWHIMKKLPEKLRGYSKYEAMKYSMHHAIYDSLTPVEFEGRWRSFISRFQLQENDWWSGLYDERHRWVPAFVKGTFWAGMSTTQRSESMNAFFYGYVNSKTTLKQFVEQYENALRSKVQKEEQEDFNSFHSFIPCITHYALENQFQDAYTTTKFKEFQKELSGKLYCEVAHVKEECGCVVYDILEDMIGETNRRANFTVWLYGDGRDFKCSCQLFDFRGILCRHSITVSINRKVDVVPEKYILRRWRKDVRRSHTKVKIMYYDWAFHPGNERFDRMCNAFYEAADLATDNEENTKLVMRCTRWLVNELKSGKGTCESSDPSVGDVTNHFQTPSPSLDIHIHIVVHGKGRPPFKRKQSKLELVVKRKKEKAKKKKEKAKKQVVHASQVVVQMGNADFENVVQDFVANGSQQQRTFQVFMEQYSQDLSFHDFNPFV